MLGSVSPLSSLFLARADNGSAVRTRFNIPISMPTVPGANSSPAPKAAAQAALGRRRSLQALEFDPLVIAKHGDKWEWMLRSVVLAWVTEAAREVRTRVADGNQKQTS